MRLGRVNEKFGLPELKPGAKVVSGGSTRPSVKLRNNPACIRRAFQGDTIEYRHDLRWLGRIIKSAHIVGSKSSLCTLSEASALSDQGLLELYVIDVGQGDSVLVRTPDD